MNTEAKSKLNREEILLRNLSSITEEKKTIEEEKRLLLRDYYENFLSETLSFSAAARMLLSQYRLRREKAREIKQSRADTIKEKTLIAKLLASRYSLEDLLEVSSETLRQVQASASIACWMSNRYSSLAYDRFCSLIPNDELIQSDSFVDVCERIHRGECDFGILPIENSTDGRLNSFYRMLDKYELKISAVCNVEDEEGDAFTGFAMVSREVYQFGGSYPRRIELSVISSNAQKMLDMIGAADQFEMSVMRLSSVPLYYRGNACVDTVTLEISENTALPFFIYLFLFGKDINVIGLYIQI